MLDVVVVGAGLFGSVTAEALRREGRRVLIVDDERPNSGSKPAACLMRPSWLSSLGKDVYNPALELLNELYGVQDLKFETALRPVSVYWCPPPKILKGADKKARVTRVVGGTSPVVTLASGEELEARSVVIAAGIWTNLLTPVYGKFVGQAGLACLWPKEKIEKPFIKVWAPYKQITAFNRGDGLWVGDSNAIRQENWLEKHALSTERRCMESTGMRKSPARIFGVRPYSGESPCYLKEAGKNVWVATGGAKNGTVGAGWCALQLSKKI